MEIARLHKEGRGFRSSLPVGMDATNQGLQIYSMVLRDPIAALATNVLPSGLPQDVYKQVADIVRRMLYEDDHEYGKKWLDFVITRKTTKRQTMTLCYGSTFFSCRAYTVEWFYDELKTGKVNPFGDETYKPCNYLAEMIWAAIGEVVQSARVGMDWLKECAVLFMEHGVTPRWSTPLGFPVKMHYENTNKYAIKTLVGGTLRQHRLRLPNGETNKRKTINSICPNWVHSLDGVGGLLGATVNLASARGIRSIRAVHDSVFVHASRASLMHQSVRDATVQIFSENQLEILAEQLAVLLPPGVSLPSIPHMGTLNINEVLNSEYYFNT
jgi:DNA-directed RNA polymerase